MATTTLTLFSGVDSSGREALWKTDGTVAGTIEIKPLFGAANNPSADFTPFGAKVVFTGDYEGLQSLFVTDGTTAGTKVIPVNNSSRVEGLIPTDLVSTGTKLFFAGIDNSDDHDLWVSNGTTAGTKIVAGTVKLNPEHLLAFGGKVLFTSQTQRGLWVSDGTAAGTKEIAGTSSLLASEMTLVDGKVFFIDAAGGGLYETDGTAAGTKGLIYAGAAQDLTAFGKKAVFESTDGNGNSNLYITDGTSAGTKLVTGTTGIFNGLNANTKDGKPVSPDFIVFKNTLFFEAVDAKGDFGLWTSNGTSAHEVTGIKGTLATGLFPAPSDPDFNGPDFAIHGSELVFDGASPGGSQPSYGLTGLWVSTGSAAGTHALTGVKNAGSSSTLGLDPSNITTVTFGTAGAAAAKTASSDHTALGAALFDAAFAPAGAMEASNLAAAAPPHTTPLAATADRLDLAQALRYA